MAGSSLYGNETPPMCFSVNRSLHYNHPIASPYFAATFTAVGLSSNLIALIVLIRAYRRTHSRSRSSFLIFLSCLVVTDFMGLLVTGPVVISYHTKRFNWSEVDPHCHLCNFMGMSMVFYGLCPLLLGAAMAVERFMGIRKPFSRSTHMSKGRVLLTVLLVWMFAGAVSLLPVIGLGSYHLQSPGSWCFFNMSSQTPDLMFSLGFSLVGLLSLTTSFILNTVSVTTLLHNCCGRDANRRWRNHEVEMMIQLIWIMIIATVSWCPLLVFTTHTALSGGPVQDKHLLLWIRFATCNQILDPWVYILVRQAVLKKVHCCSGGLQFDMYPSFVTLSRPLHANAVDGTGTSNPDNLAKTSLLLDSLPHASMDPK
ncbi:thromboxane A2 receptor-like isoform X3 [Brienomyrus brachyistius]|uniref:thromboxane A2 receptor-like isoform X3 n=1 Tax=Brienomyrus brachyistius TaxID=42636 RepID=UPI0020B30603|nr:thromboxane A2 receptor-like isoform X3 [Brienomyrus brachyistius]